MGKIAKLSLLTFIIILNINGSLLAEGLEIDGYLENYYSVRLKNDHNFIGERSQLNLNLRHLSDNIYIFASIKGINNQVVEEKDIVIIHEAYLEYSQPLWDLKIGRQIYSWGRADGLKITDILNPCDYSEYITRDFDEIRVAVDSVKYHYMFPGSDLELVWIPTFVENIIPKQGNPWYVDNFEGLTINQAEEIENNLGNSELAARWSLYLQGLDFSVSTAYLWDDETAYHKEEDGSFTPEYHRLKYYGLDLAKPLGNFVIRSESAYFQGKYFSADNGEGVLERDYIHSLAGLDWYPGNNWTISAQLANQYIIDYEGTINEEESQNIASLRLSKNLFRETLELENMLYYEQGNEDGFNRFSIDYALSDSFHLLAGIDYFYGDKGEFSYYDGNDSIWIKTRYNF